MDVAIEVEEELEAENYTMTNATKYFYDGLYPHQIGGLAFSLFCLAPNILILYIICRYKLTSTLYWTITNWTILNSLLIINCLPLYVVPGSLITLLAGELIVMFGVTLFTFTAALLTLFMFDFFLKSEKICKYSTIGIWFLIVCCDVCVVISINNKQGISYIMSIILEILFFVITIIFAARVIFFCFKTPNEESYSLRIRLCTTYLASFFLVWATEFMAYIHHYYIFLAVIGVIVIYLDGYINLIVLIYFDPRIKRHFLQMFCGSDNYADIKFDTQSSIITVVDQNQGIYPN